MRNELIFAGLLLVLALLLVPGALAFRTYRVCANSTHLYEEANVAVEGTDYKVNQTIYCNHGCDTDRSECKEPYKPSGDVVYMSLVLYLSLFLMAAAALAVGYWKQTVIFTLFSTIMFCVLALQTFSFDIVLAGTSFSSLTAVFVGLCWIFAILGIMLSIYGAFHTTAKEVGKK